MLMGRSWQRFRAHIFAASIVSPVLLAPSSPPVCSQSMTLQRPFAVGHGDWDLKDFNFDAAGNDRHGTIAIAGLQQPER
jgi:hypothetical protein